MKVAFNKCLRKIWRLPFNTNTGILHCTAGVQNLFTVICRHSNSFSLKASCCPNNRLVKVMPGIIACWSQLEIWRGVYQAIYRTRLDLCLCRSNS